MPILFWIVGLSFICLIFAWIYNTFRRDDTELTYRGKTEKLKLNIKHAPNLYKHTTENQISKRFVYLIKCYFIFGQFKVHIIKGATKLYLLCYCSVGFFLIQYGFIQVPVFPPNSFKNLVFRLSAFCIFCESVCEVYESLLFR